MPFRKVIVPKTTNNITKGIINFLNSEGHCASRINTTGIWDAKKQCYRRTGGRKGALDISVTLKTKNGLGLSHWIDIKKDDDELSPDQIKFIQDQEKAGGICYEAKDLQSYEKYYYSQIKPMLLRL